MRTPAPAEVYVYYRVVADSAAAREAMDAFLAAVAGETGVAGRLLARYDDAATWREVYAPVADAGAFARRLGQLAMAHRIDRFAVDGVRHTECFAPLAAVTARDAPGAG
jgi:hypothetical protein